MTAEEGGALVLGARVHEIGTNPALVGIFLGPVGDGEGAWIADISPGGRDARGRPSVDPVPWDVLEPVAAG